MVEKITVAELFAGVGGFRLGLEGWQGKSALSGYTNAIDPGYEVVWSNQWEPTTKAQVASQVYTARYGALGHTNIDIATIDANAIPNVDMLVGGFPCQDYSVARTLHGAEGLKGKKGVLWWEIHRIIAAKAHSGHPVKYLLLENVDRILQSPATQRGRDMAIIMASLADLGYSVEWRVINAADFGFPQRRRRTFILAYHRDTPQYQRIAASTNIPDIINKTGIPTKAFPIGNNITDGNSFLLTGDTEEIAQKFNRQPGGKSPFRNAGVVIGREVWTQNVTPNFGGPYRVLRDIIEDDSTVHERFFVDDASITKWQYMKGAKREWRINKATGGSYHYSEGKMPFPDALDKPSRTIITSEGGPAPSRCKHVIMGKEGHLRRLTPVELERLNMFPDGHTAGLSDTQRAFLMGNALVVGLIEQIGEALLAEVRLQKATILAGSQLCTAA